MDEGDEEGEARALASKWVERITAKMGLVNAVRCNVGKQVHNNDDNIDESSRKCGDLSNKNNAIDAFHSLNCNDFVVNSSQISESEEVGTQRPALKTDSFDSLESNHCSTTKDARISGCLLLDGKQDSVENKVSPTDSIHIAESGIMRNLQSHIPSNDELYDIWDFDEQQKRQAECYLKGTDTNFTAEKENFPIVNEKVFDQSRDFRSEHHSLEAKPGWLEKSTSLSGSDGNQNLYKICPSCKEHNSVMLNWCEECGKALISVEVTRAKVDPVCGKYDSNRGTGEAKWTKEAILTSKLNPNCAEFVSAYSKPQNAMPLQASNGNLLNTETPPSDNQDMASSPTCNPSYFTAEIAKLRYGCKSYEGVSDYRKVGDFKSDSSSKNFSAEHRKDKQQNKKSKQNKIRRRRSSSSFELNSQSPVSHAVGSNSFSSIQQQLSYSFSPSNSPVNAFVGYSNSHNMTMPFCATNSSLYGNGALTIPGQYECSAVQGTKSQYDRRVFPQNQGDGRSNSLIQGYDGAGYNGVSYGAKGCFQGFDFENPPLDNPYVLEPASNFDEKEFSRSFVQNALHQQIEYAHGLSSHHHQANIAQNVDFPLVQPAIFFLQSSQPTVDLPNHRAYRKKKFIENGIESPRFAKNVLRKPMQSQQGMKSKRNYKQECTVYDSHRAKNNPHEASKLPPEVNVPPLKLDDLDNYDQVLTLIRTARDEALPYLCLPEEIILYIFSYLSTSDLCKCARVCQQFYRISVDESLWKEITLKKRKDLSDETLKKISKKAPISLTITQCHGKHVTEHGIRSLFQSCGENLLDLDFSACSGKALVGELILLHVSTRCRKLRSLDISWANVSDIGIQAVSEALTRLECLCMNGCQSITDEATRCIANRHGENMRVLEMFGCFNITHVSLTILKDNCPNIETLNIGQCHKVSDNAISEFVRSAPRLENIDLRGCKQIRDNAIKALALNCPKLSTLVIANCPLITDDSLFAISSHLLNIRCIDVCGCPKITDKGIQALARACSKLQMLDLSSTKASDRAVMSLANYCFKTLEVLKMSFCHKITEISLEHLAKKCIRLTLLHLYGCKRIKNLRRVQNCRGTLKIEN